MTSKKIGPSCPNWGMGGWGGLPPVFVEISFMAERNFMLGPTSKTNTRFFRFFPWQPSLTGLSLQPPEDKAPQQVWWKGGWQKAGQRWWRTSVLLDSSFQQRLTQTYFEWWLDKEGNLLWYLMFEHHLHWDNYIRRANQWGRLGSSGLGWRVQVLRRIVNWWKVKDWATPIRSWLSKRCDTSQGARGADTELEQPKVRLCLHPPNPQVG